MDAGSMVLVAWYGLEFVVAAPGAVVGHDATRGPAGPHVIVVAPAGECSSGLPRTERPNVLCGEER
jgi:hypothetical protein